MDRAVELATEEAIVRAVESGAVERALVRVLQGPAVEEAARGALDSPQVERAIVEALDSEMVERVWDRLLESDEVQRLIERIAEAPEIRSAISAQGIGLIQDLGRQLARITRRLDDGIEWVVRRLLRRPRREERAPQAGLLTRLLAFAVDALLLNGGILLLWGLIAGLVSALSPGDESISTAGVALGAVAWLFLWTGYLLLFWALAGQTPGMRFVGIRIVADGEHALGLRRSLRRLVGLVLAVIPFGLGLIGILTTDRRRGFQDRYADTDVLYAQPGIPGTGAVAAAWDTIAGPVD